MTPFLVSVNRTEACLQLSTFYISKTINNTMIVYNIN